MNTDSSFTPITRHFHDISTLLQECSVILADAIAEVAQSVLLALMSDGKLLIAGDGALASLANTFSAYMVTQLQAERMGLAAVSLNGNASVIGQLMTREQTEQLFARQVHALGKPHDVLCVLSADGDSSQLQAAVRAAHERDMQVVALTGGTGGAVAGLLSNQDFLLNIPSTDALQVLEAHTVVVHVLCAQIDQLLLDGL